MEPGYQDRGRRGADEATTYEERAYRAIKRDIIACSLEPGLQVSATMLAERYQFGLAAIRSALNRLNQERLVEAVPRVGYRIEKVTFAQVHDLFSARELVEGATARMAASKATTTEIERLKSLAGIGYSTHDVHSLDRYIDANREFHLLIAEITRIEYIQTVLEDILSRMDRVLNLSHAQLERPPGHQMIVTALEDRDADEAAWSMINHINATREFVVYALTLTPSFDAVNLRAIS